MTDRLAALWWRIVHRIFGCGDLLVRHWWGFDYGFNCWRIECKRCGKRTVQDVR